MDPAAIQAIAAAVAQAMAQGQNAPAAAAPFALTPGRANPADALDYTTRTGQAVFKDTTESLPHKFDVELQSINQFCKDL